MRSALLLSVVMLCLSGCNDSRVEISSSQNSDGKWSVSVTATVDSRTRVEAYRSVARTLETQAKSIEESIAANSKSTEASSVVKPEAEVKPVTPPK